MRRIGMAVGIVLVISCVTCGWLYHHTSRYDYIISQAAARNGLDFYLVKALIHEESWYRSEVRGSAGEIGLMQITKAAASDFANDKGFPPISGDRLLEPELNVEIGCWYLRQSIDHYRGSPEPILFALLRYNAGESRANNWMRLALSAPRKEGVPVEDLYLSFVDFPKTRAYVHRILQRTRTRSFWY
jgi:soluble lytic murein transglycosylase